MKVVLGAIDRVCAVNAFNEGVNVPTVGLVAFCRVTTSLTIFRQQLGRGLRPGKDKLIVLDFVGNLERIQLVLEMMNKISDLYEEYMSEREREREGYNRQRFEVSGAGFTFTFSDKVVDLMRILGHVKREFYPTWQEAGAAAQALGIRTSHQYRREHRKDPQLPSNPFQTFPDFPSWGVYLNRFYTYTEAAKCVRALGIVSARLYKKYVQKGGDLRLPSTPERTYKDKGWVSWDAFFGREELYTYEEASAAVQRLGIKRQYDYERYRKRANGDPRLPSTPSRTYRYTGWNGWPRFLGRKDQRGGDWRARQKAKAEQKNRGRA